MSGSGGRSRLISRLSAAVLIGGLPLLAGCGGTPAPSAGQPTQQAQSMRRMQADMQVLRAFAEGTGTQENASIAASELVSWSNRMSELFPPEAAARYVDMSPDIARGATAAMSATATSLQAAVRSGNRPNTAAEVARTERAGCGFCHQRPIQ